MGTKELTAKIKEYKEMKRLAEECLAIADSIADELKAYMSETGQTKAIINEYKLSLTEITRVDIDKKRLEAEQTEIYAEYQKITCYKRFLVS